MNPSSAPPSGSESLGLSRQKSSSSSAQKASASGASSGTETTAAREQVSLPHESADGADGPGFVGIEVGKRRLDELGLFFTSSELRTVFEDDILIREAQERIQRLHVKPIVQAATITDEVNQLWARASSEEELERRHKARLETLACRTVYDEHALPPPPPEEKGKKKKADAAASTGNKDEARPIPPARLRQIETLLKKDPRLRNGLRTALRSIKAAQADAQSEEKSGTVTDRVKRALSERYRKARESQWSVPTTVKNEFEKRNELLMADSNTEYFFKQRRLLMTLAAGS
ncbi:unnamed protein product [Amoebophrya sp. A25]|nr:unnamed protein product [Amoebophrya sp. A25]|eukprot:GSA25T00024186001.1